MLQRKGIPRSFSNASYFHGTKPILPTHNASPSNDYNNNGDHHYNNRNTSRSPTRNNSNNGLRRRLNSANNAMMKRDGFIASMSVLSAVKVLSVILILLVAGNILRRMVWEINPATEDLILSSSSSSKLSSKLSSSSSQTSSKGTGGGLRSSSYWSTLDEQKLPLSEFPSIQYALDHSDIVLLYYAASWCPMSTPVTELLDAKFGDILLPSAFETRNTGTTKKFRRPMSLVYVSSDETADQMNQYARRHWITLPFDTDERTRLKRHFKVAAKKEMAQIGMQQRIYEIPTIIIVSGQSHNVVTTHGVEDLKQKGSEALIHWIKLLHTIKRAENNYY